jgi:hypothetical protein
MNVSTSFSFLSHSPASSKDRKNTYYSLYLNGYSTQWAKHVAPRTASELASDLEIIGVDAFIKAQKEKHSFTSTDLVSEALNEAYKAHDYNAPDNY